MFRSETLRERSLLRQIEAMQRTINDQNDRLMFLVTGMKWTPDVVEDSVPDEPVLAGALDGVPPGWDLPDE